MVRRVMVVLLIWVALFVSLRAGAQPVSEFYRGKQIRIVVGSAAGGAYDGYARTIAAHMGNHIPGTPSFIVQNMPGAGSLVALNNVVNIAPKDGTVIAAIHADTVTAPLFHPERAKFDSRALNWLGAPVTVTYVITAWRTAPVRRFEDLFTKELIVAAAGGDSITLPLLTNALLGTKFKIVQGYKSAAAGLLAIERGEAQGNAGDALSFLKAAGANYLKSGDLRVIGSYGLKPDAELKGVPLVMDYAKTSEQKSALSLILSEQDFGWPYVMARGVPGDRVELMRKAFDETMNDPAFLAEAKKRRLDIRPARGVDQARLIAATFETPKKVIDKVKRIVGE
jgi:tripartite-type tricarboxylate transporter receptor subunit TctC